MSLQLIKANPLIKRDFVNSEKGMLRVSEFFCDTIQGEGIYTGHPATFLRLQGCTLDCLWCDTASVWKTGNPYTFKELFDLMDSATFDLIRKLKQGQHLVLTGGSPLLQQKQLFKFIVEFYKQFKFKPFIEIENECIVSPIIELTGYIDCWNNSPKLTSSGNRKYMPENIKALAGLPNSWFKFVVSSQEDWSEIFEDYLLPNLIKESQIILMPQGASIAELNDTMNFVVDLAIKNNVRFSNREHVILWNKTVGV